MGNVFYKDIVIETTDSVYEPREDSFLLAAAFCPYAIVARDKDKNLVTKGSHEKYKTEIILMATLCEGKEVREATAQSVAKKVLDMGTGSGILAILAARQGAAVTATDINEGAIQCAQKNAALNKAKDIEFLCGDLFEPVSGRKFDLIIFNPPYLPKEEKYVNKKIDLSYNSSETLENFLKEYKRYLGPGGRALIVNSSISGVAVDGIKVAEQKLAFERLEVIELK